MVVFCGRGAGAPIGWGTGTAIEDEQAVLDPVVVTGRRSEEGTPARRLARRSRARLWCLAYGLVAAGSDRREGSKPYAAKPCLLPRETHHVPAGPPAGLSRFLGQEMTPEPPERPPW